MERPTPYNGDKPFIFISYSHKDSHIVWPIISRMIDDGYRVWYDDGINPGTEWDEFIASKISECDYYFGFISENFLNSDNCKDEINYARDNVENKLLIYLTEVKLSKGMEMRLGRIQAIFSYTFKNQEDFFKKLYVSNNIEKFVDRKSYSIETKPEVEPEKKTTVSTKSVALLIASFMAAFVGVIGATYFIDAYKFYVDKFNGSNLATRNLVFAIICIIFSVGALAMPVINVIRQKRAKN